MKNKDETQETNTDQWTETEKSLRRRAEETSREKNALPPDDSKALSPEQMRLLMHELQVHQVELTMQNEELRAAQAELEESRTRYFELYDLAPIGYLTFSEQGFITLANLTAATLLGVKRSALLSAPITRYIHKEDQDIYYRHRKKLFENGESQECELRLVKPEGSHFWAHLRITVAQVEDGAPLCRLVFSNITERKQAEEQIKRLAQIADSAPGSILVHDYEGNMFYANERTFHLHGYEKEEFMKLNLRDIDVPESAELITARIKEIEETGEAEFEVRHVRKDSSTFPLQVYVKQTEWFGKPAMLSVSTDITERKNTEEALKLQARERAAVDTFTYSVSNDLQAPLRRIEGFSEALLEECPDELSNQAQDYLKRIVGQVGSMTKLTDALLQLSRVVSREIDRGTVDLSALVRSNLEKLQYKEPKRQLELVVAPGLITEGDTELLNLMLAKLLDNAWKFTSGVEGAKIEFGSNEQNGRTVYYLKDNGIGFGMSHAEKLFAPFQKLHSGSAYPGIGIGLNLAYRIISRHGGEIWAEGEPGKGACFYFILP